MGLQIILDSNFADSSLPILPKIDDIESSGSLLLFDAAKSITSGGVPQGNATGEVAVNNLFAKNAAAIINNTEVNSQLKAYMWNYNSSRIKTELTLKGGIHIVTTQSGSQTSSNHYAIKPSNAIAAYMQSNTSHNFYFSVWARLTRAGTATVPQPLMQWIGSTASTRGHYFAGNAITQSGSTSKKIQPVGFDLSSVSSVSTAVFASLEQSGWTGTLPSGGQVPYIAAGANGAFESFNLNKSPSVILYRWYVEDLTISGRTYFAVEALDNDLFNAVFGVGGVYADDTYTDPDILLL